MSEGAVAAVILAAGAGRRMGQPKARVVLQGESLLHRTARVTLAAGCAPVLAVVGSAEAGPSDLDVRVVPNPEAEEGLASSIRAGVMALPPDTPATLFLAVDQPQVDAALLTRLMALYRLSPDLPAACAYAGTLGIPAVFPRRLFPQLLGLAGDRGAKAILLREGAASLPFPGGALDLDTPADLDSFRR